MLDTTSAKQMLFDDFPSLQTSTNVPSKMADAPTSALTRKVAMSVHAQTPSLIWRRIVLLALVRIN